MIIFEFLDVYAIFCLLLMNILSGLLNLLNAFFWVIVPSIKVIAAMILLLVAYVSLTIRGGFGPRATALGVAQNPLYTSLIFRSPVSVCMRKALGD